MSYPLIVIGSGPAGVSAARAYLDAGGDGPVLLVSRDANDPYERPPLSKEALREPGDVEGSPIVEPKKLADIEVRLNTAVTGLDLDARSVQLGDASETYDSLIVAAGMQPIAVPDADDDADVHLLRSLEDAESLKQAAMHARSAVVIGSGFIGCEASVSLARLGIETTMVTHEDGPQLARLGDHASKQIVDWLSAEGVTVETGVEVTGIRAPRTIHLDNGTTLQPDLILAAIGVQPATDFLEPTGLQLHEGRLVVDEHLHSTDQHVWAAGDAARAMNVSAGRPISVEHWDDAMTMGELAGKNAAGGSQSWDAVPGFWSQIGDEWLQYSAWGDGFDEAEVVERPGGFTVWYGQDGTLVGVLTYNADNDYERGGELIKQGADLAAAVRGDAPEAEAEPEAVDEPSAE